MKIEKHADGNWSIDGFLLGCDSAFIEHMMAHNRWTATDVVDHIMHNVATALKAEVVVHQPSAADVPAKFAHTSFENLSQDGLQQVISELGQVYKDGFNLIAATSGEMICSYSGTIPFESFEDVVRNIVWQHNEGMFCETVKRSLESVEQYL